METPASVSTDRGEPNVLFITYNGHGLGHITRMMAVAKHAEERFTPMFLTLSEAFPLLSEHGFVNEYLSSFEKLDMTKEEWEPLFASRLAQALQHCQPRVVVFDLVRPPPVLADIRSGSTGFELIWSRRGMWERRRNRVSIHVGRKAFDGIVEPGDIASPLDVGRTTDDRSRVTWVPPIVLVSPEEQTHRLEARGALGLPEHGRAILINVSDSAPENLARLISSVRDTVRSAAGEEELHLFAPLHPLHRGAMPSVPGVTMRPIYPVAKHIRAFDGVVSTAGYNSFHETVASGLPAVFVPRDSPSLDDQHRRALFADLCGRAFFAETFEDEGFQQGVKKMLAPGEAGIAAAVTDELGAFTGGSEFADFIASRCRELEDVPYRVGFVSGMPRAEQTVLDRFASGRQLSPAAMQQADRVIMVALGRDDAGLGDLAAQLSRTQHEAQSFKPVLLVDHHVDPQTLNDEGFQFETIMSSEGWATVGTGAYQAYLESRMGELRRRYQTERVVILEPGEPVDPSKVNA